jgi:putative ABC transport system permease protein
MIKNYFKIAFRNLLRNKGFSAINISGLAVGMASAILILLWIQNEISYDKFHKNKDYLYEAWNRGTFNNKVQCWNSTPKILGPTLKQEYPEIADVARTGNQWFVTTVGVKQLSSSGMFADPSFLNMFSFPLLQGNAKSALSSVYDVVVTKKMAIKMFGTEDAMGKILRIDSNNFTVTGILKDLPTNTRFDFEFIMPWAFVKKLGWDDDSWGNNSVNTFVQLKPNVTEALVDSKIVNITKKHSNGDEQQEVFLHPIAKWHLYSNFENGKVVGGLIAVVITFAIIASFILLIACINFMNLSTARSEKRAKEVGIRKVVGAGKGSLIAQFLGESVLIALISGIIALFLVQLSLPAFDTLANKQLTVPYTNIYFWSALLLFIAATGAIAGSYPAFFLSSFQPVKVLKGTFKRAQAFINPRKVLVVLQFTFAIVLIVSTIIVTQQMKYAQARNTGYERGQLVYHFITGDLDKKFTLVKNELLSSGAAVSVTKTSSPLTEGWSDTWGISWQGKAVNDKTDFDRFSEDEGLVKTAGLKIVQGRDMDLKTFPSDSSAIILNESAVKAMNFKSPIGQILKDNGKDWHVIGVIKDFVLRSPYEPTRPMFISGSNSYFNVINIKLNAANSTVQNMKALEKIFKAYNPQYPFEYHFVDEQYARKFEDTQRTASLIGVFAGLTIFISCLGLFGLAAYMAENRIKEIGVRKVLGASVLSITTLLSKEFLALVIISLLIASPIAWFFMSKWLGDYSYRINIEWWVFAMAGALSVIISLATVSFQAIKAAIANPVKSLRSE